MDITTHALASFALTRAFFPGRRWPVFLGAVFAGTLADIDLLSAFFGPAAYFSTRRTFTHSLLGIAVIVALASVLTSYLSRKQAAPFRALLLPLFLPASLHIALDLLQSEGVAVLWPLRSTRFATDWLPPIDPWILAILILGCFVPEFFRLITSEIGVKNRAPRGRNGALIALALLVFYVAAREILHSSSVGLLDPHSYAGESARKVGAYPDALSLFSWHGVVETRSLVCLVEVPAAFGKPFDPESAECMHKPEASPELTAAQAAVLAQAYLHAVPFPRATIAKSADGSEVELRSMRDIAEHETAHRVGARLTVDPQLKISGQEFVWVNELRLR